ncbi:ubiquitin C-terminal hydrolase 22-like isoform X2 [Lolium rigidum]|nr:ubiquitin C-terminal hydrolase 22-like isoform X2 [Lolium rigidum]
MTSPSAPPPCPHLAAHRLTSRPLRFLRRCLRVRPLGRPEIRRDAREVPRCSPCPSSSPPPARLYACLSCATVFCPSHAASHASSSSPGHQIAVDVDRAELFCAACGDQVYDPDFDHAVVLAQSTALHPPSTSTSTPTPAPRKRRRVDYRAWAPDPAESALVSSAADPTTSASATEPAGLRGLNNLGNTCFMNSVLQALLHAPPLRNYFLGDRHNRFLCPRRTPMRHRATDADAKAACLACDLDEIYSATFSGERTPYSPAKFLYSWWQHATNLASYEQQDAHEFFISILDHIHENIKDDEHKSHEQG